MMHWKATWVVLALVLAVSAGCSQKCCLHDFDDFSHRAGVPSDLATNPDMQNQRATPDVSTPTDIDYPERESWFITLHEAIAMALEGGVTGTQSVRGFGTIDDDLINFRSLGTNFAFGDSIRVLALDPSINGTNIEANLARYDAVVRSVLGFTTADNPSNASSGFRNGQFTIAGASIEKALPSGGLANITFGSPTNQGSLTAATNFYSKFNSANFINGSLNPQYTPDLKFGFSQPLFKGFGTDINGLLAQHPSGGAQTLISSNETQQSGIVIARISFDQQRADFERAVTFLLANVETAYWNLYGSFVNLYSAEQALRQSHVTWKISKSKYDAGAIAVTQFAQTRGQYEQFRGDRLQALGKVLEAERVLRALMGLKMEDGKRLVPVDTPTVDLYTPDWSSAQQECLNLRPELAMQRNDLKQKQLELIRENNSLLPTVNLETQYAVHGAGSRLDGDSVFASGLTDNAFRSLAGGHFADYGIGISANMPARGFRAQNANVRAAKLRLAQSFLQLRDEETRATRYLVQQYRAVTEAYKVIEARRAQRAAFAEQVEARFKEFIAGKTTADFLLEAQRQWANALSVEYTAIVEYNNSLVRYQFAKGTLLQHNGIQIAEGQLPKCAQVRAVEHERQRAAAIVCREEANVVVHPVCSPEAGVFGNPILPANGATSVPALMGGAPKTPDAPLPGLTQGTGLPGGNVPVFNSPTLGTKATTRTLPTIPMLAPANGTPTYGVPLPAPATNNLPIVPPSPAAQDGLPYIERR